MEETIRLLAKFDFVNLIALVLLAWFLHRTITAKVNEVRNEFREDFKDLRREMKEEVKEIHKEFKFINIRLSRAEGTVYGKDIYKKEAES